MSGQHEAGTQILCFRDGFKALLRVCGDGSGWWCQQIGVGLMVRAPDTAAELVQLCQPELVRALDDNGVGAGNVDAGFDNGGAHQHVEALVIEVRHDLFQLALAHLAMGNAHACFRDQLAQILGGFLDGGHIVVQEVHLAASQYLPQDGFFDHGLVPLSHKGFYRQASRGGRGDDRQIPQVPHGHVEGAGDRRGGQVQHVHLGTQGLQTFFLLDAEPVFFIDDHQAQILELDVTLEQLVCADNNIGFAGFDGGHRFGGLPAAPETAE